MILTLQTEVICMQTLFHNVFECLFHPERHSFENEPPRADEIDMDTSTDMIRLSEMRWSNLLLKLDVRNPVPDDVLRYALYLLQEGCLIALHALFQLLDGDLKADVIPTTVFMTGDANDYFTTKLTHGTPEANLNIVLLYQSSTFL